MLATIVSQDPMYVIFPVSVRTGARSAQALRDKGGFSAVVIKLRLPDGRIYGQAGKLDYSSTTRRRQHRHASRCAASSPIRCCRA